MDASDSESPSCVDKGLERLPAKSKVDHVVQIFGVLQAGYMVPFGRTGWYELPTHSCVKSRDMVNGRKQRENEDKQVRDHHVRGATVDKVNW